MRLKPPRRIRPAATLRGKQKYILWLKEISAKDVPLVGGKNASLGEMFSQLSKKGIHPVKSRKARIPPKAELFNGVNIPDGFALTTKAYWHFLKENKIDKKLKEIFKKFQPKSLKSLQETGKAARNLILKAKFPKDLEGETVKTYRRLSAKYGQKDTDVAVRSSGMAEDSPRDSFAGQFETFLNVSGEKNLLAAVKKCLASAFNDRVIAYREEKKINHLKFAPSVGVQKMVRSDLASSGVIFTLDTESGFPNVVLINSIFGIGEMIVKGRITPDEFYVFKPTLRRFAPQGKSYRPIIVKNLGRKTKKYIYSGKGGLKEINVPEKDQLRFSLSDEEVLTLAKWACLIEEHYKIPQDIEWAKDGKSGLLFVVQSRPETVHTPSFYEMKTKAGDETKSQRSPSEARREMNEVQRSPKEVKLAKRTASSSSPSLPLRGSLVYEEYEIKTKEKPILTGIAIGNKIGQGKARIIPSISQISKFQKGEVLVTKMTNPDWVSVFPLASAIVTDEGGKTAHAAIVSRELGLPCIVGTKGATKILKNGQEITVDCTQGLSGRIFLGKIPFRVKRYNLKKIPKLKTKIMINIGAPEIAFKTSFLPQDGVGLARQEFIIAEKIRVHPLALYHYREIINSKSQITNKFQITNSKLQTIIKQIDEITVEHKDKREYFVKELAEGIAQIASAFWPKPVIVRLSDLKTNEYRALIGGELFEPEEANPMLGWRGASRYYDEKFRPAFEMECRAIKRVREIFGLKNIKVMIPFCRTIEEGENVLKSMKRHGLERGKDGLEVYVMCEIPSNVILADKFLDIFDGMSVGSNDLTQLLLGLDRDSALVAKVGDERNPVVKKMIVKVIQECKKRKKYSGICGQAPSDYQEFAEFLVEQGIDSISLNPDTVIKTTLIIAKKEKQLGNKK